MDQRTVMNRVEELRTKRTFRLAVTVLVVLLVLPTVASGLAQLGGEERGDLAAAENVTFVSAQGGFGAAEDGRVVALDTDTREIVWEFARGGPGDDVLYYDVDPLSADELLVVEQVTGEGASVLRVNWRTGEVTEEFEVPLDTHDVDYLGDGRYVVADKFHHRAYVYDRPSDSVVWEYNFSNHFPEYPEAGEDPSTQRSGAGGYTHLNDVDAVEDGSAFLLSPRNFDRVVLVNRSTKETEFVLGAEDDHDVLHEQHNPVLLTADPPTVLVADSENDRIVEYRRRADDSWEPIWRYGGDLHWPRDADRLPNGNTLVVDTFGQRVLEVTPEKEIVWEREVTKMPYDVERLQYGDEPAGPPTEPVGSAVALGGSADSPPSSDVGIARQVYAVALWVLPAWIGLGEFYGLLAAVAIAVCWLGAELLARFGVPSRAA